jgi:acetyl esterase/lipase
VIDRRALMAGLGVSAGAMLAARQLAAAPVQEPGEWIDLWPGGAPGAPDPLPGEQIVERSSDPLSPDRIMQNIAQPRMALFRPAEPNGAAVLITPGGGYRHVVIDKEGFEMARWLAARGVTAAVLFYRLPHEGWATGPDTPLADAQRAMRLLRYRHAASGIDAQRISIMGFSAGGHVAASLVTRFAAPAYTPVDSADALSARPDAAALIYPVISMRADIAHPGSRERLLGAAFPAALELAHSPDANVPENAPSCFILHAEDDDVVPVENALGMRAALKAKRVAVETHLYARGGHGFGISRAAGKPVAAWPEVWLGWARAMGLA